MTLDEKIVEAVARAIDPEIWAVSGPVPTRGDTEDFHRRRQASVAKARAAITAFQAEVKPTAWLTTHERFGSELTDTPLTEGDMGNGWSQTALYALPPAPKASPDRSEP